MTEFDVTTVENEAEIAEIVRMPYARHAAEISEILSETGCHFIQFSNSWWGNETFGHWADSFFVVPNGISDSGKALFVRNGVVASEAIGKLSSAKSINRQRREGSTGYTSEAARRFRRKAFNWNDDRKLPGPGMLPTDDRDSFKNGSCPLSVIDVAIRAPESGDHFIFENGEVSKGKLSDADIVVDSISQTHYGAKFVFAGDTYNAFKKDGVSDELDWDECHATFNGDNWVADVEAIVTVAEALNEAGYSVGVDSRFEDHVSKAKDNSDGDPLADSFGVGN